MELKDGLGEIPSRRQLVAGLAVAFGGVLTISEAFAKAQQPTMPEPPGSVANKARTFLHQEVDFDASPHRIYEALLSSKDFAALTGMSAKIDPKEGGEFKTFSGIITGRNIELIPDKRIVQAWRPNSWDPGIYSIVKFELKPHGSGTTVVLDHTGFPEGKFDGLDSGWPLRYWNPLKKFLA